jgi:hypothetical protein
VPSAFFLEYHDHRRTIRDSTRIDNTHFEKFLNNFLNFILLGKGMTISMNIERKTSQYERNDMIMDATRRGKSMGSIKNRLASREYILEVGMHRGCLKCLNGMELRNNSKMTFSEEFFHSMGTDDLRGSYCDSLDIILLSLMLELHG